MPLTPSLFRSWIRARDRLRTPRIHRVVQTGTTIVVVEFDRDMDQVNTEAVVRTFDTTNGVVEWSGFSWVNSRAMASLTSSVITASFSGQNHGTYISGDIAAVGRRYFVPNYERSDRLELS